MLTHSESIAKIASALSKAQGAMRAAVKDAVNPHFKSRYADLAGVWDACREPLATNGLAVLQSPGEIQEKSIALTTMLTHESGEWMRATFTIPVTKPDAQGVGGSITYARRYALAAMVGIVQDDDEQRHSVYVPQKPKDEGRPFDLQIALQAIKGAKTIELLKAVYLDAYTAADNAGDKAAMSAIVSAKDARKSELSSDVPSKLKDAVGANDPDDVPFEPL